MTWTEGITLCLGIATLVVTIVGWLVTFLSGRTAAKERERAEERLAGQQGDIDARLRMLEANLAVRSQVQIVHSEHEIGIYRLLWERIDEIMEAINFLPSAGEERRPAVFEDVRKFMVDLERTVSRNQPFYSDEVFRECQNLLSRTTDIQTIELLEDRLGNEAGAEFVQRMFDDVADFSERILNAIRRRNAQIAGLPEPDDVTMFPPPPHAPSEES